jgi:putative heme-binding domain-containing protein
LGADPAESERLAQQFIDGELPKSLLPQIAGALGRHVEQDESGRIAALLNETFKGGLLLSLDPAEVAEVEKLVETTGDARNGRSVYLNAQKSQCANCHRLEGIGGAVGPDLTRIWETHTVAKILESMTDPSKEIKEGFQSYTAITNNGQVYQGLKVRDDGQEVVLRDQDGNDITIATDDVDRLEESKKSLMPEGVVAQLSYQELIDLVAFLRDRDEQVALRGMLTQVWVAGPYEHALTVTDAVEQNPDPLSPPKGPEGETLTWQRLGANPDGLFDIRKVQDVNDAAVYALAFVHSPEAQTARFNVWFDDELRLIVNGRTVHTSESVHTDAVVDVPLDEGWNTVLARVVNHRGDFAFRVSIADGRGLRFSDLPK